LAQFKDLFTECQLIPNLDHQLHFVFVQTMISTAGLMYILEKLNICNVTHRKNFCVNIHLSIVDDTFFERANGVL